MRDGHASQVRAWKQQSWLIIAVVVALALALLAPATSEASSRAPGGPVILMGLDSELTPGQSSHGPPEDHQAMVRALLAEVRNGGEGILVIGPDSRNFRNYWVGDVGDPLDVAVTFVNGVADIGAVSFDGYAMIGIASSFAQVSGGLSQSENEALIDRQLDIADFVNGGGGLLGKTQDGMNDPFGYVGPLARVELTSTGFSSVTVTDAGLDLGLTQNGMDGWCCYHEVFDSFPGFMDVLITHNAAGVHRGKAAAIGGVNVVVPTGIDLEPDTATLTVGETHKLVASVEEDDEPAADVEVIFTVTSGPHDGETGTSFTDSDGVASIEYIGTTAGTDTVVATFVDLRDRTRTSNEVTVEWEATPAPAAEGLSLAPTEDTGAIGDEHTVTATLLDDNGDPITDAEISFEITDGPHKGDTATAATDSDGKAAFTYEGTKVGTDTIIATHTPEKGDKLTSNEATVEWEATPTSAAEGLSLAPSKDTGTVGDEHTVTATLTDDEGGPQAEAEVVFTVTEGPNEGESLTAETDADGEATFTYVGAAEGTDTIVATHTPEDGDIITSGEATMEWAEVLSRSPGADDDDEVDELKEAKAPKAIKVQPTYTG